VAQTRRLHACNACARVVRDSTDRAREIASQIVKEVRRPFERLSERTM
jgi:hypothetical protein